MRSKRLRGVCAATIGAMAWCAAPASAQTVVTAKDDQFLPANPTIAQGESLQFLNDEAVPKAHDLTHGPDANPILFSTPTVLGGDDPVVVTGASSLAAGTYPFYCTFHEDTMLGTLTVTGDGPPPPPPPPQVQVELRSTKLAKVVAKRELKAAVSALPPTPATGVVLVASLAGRRIVRPATVDVGSAQTLGADLALNRSGRRLLRERLEDEKGARVQVTATAPGGNVDSDRGKLKY